MNSASIKNIVFWAVTFGGLVAILAGEQRAVSLRVWLAALVLWFAFAAVRRLAEGVPLIPASMRSLITLRRQPFVLDTTLLRELRGLEGLILRSRDNSRAYVQQLQPRLEALADHYLPVTHGIDRHTQPERAAELLGPLAWLLDVELHERTPTLDELDALVELLTNSASNRTEEAA